MSTATERFAPLIAKYPPLLFEYNPEAKSFTVGADVVSLEEYVSYNPDTPDSISEDAAVQLMETGTLMLNVLDKLYQFPTMYNWLLSLNSATLSRLAEDTTDVLIDVYSTLDEDMSGKHDRDRMSAMGFNAGFYRPGHPGFQVFGSCACFGVSVDDVQMDDKYWSEGYSEYAFHNVDSKVQEIALLAGAGALGRECRAGLGL